MWHILFAITTAYCGVKWLRWKLTTYAWAWYIETRGYRHPNDNEIKACTRAVIKSLLKH